MWTELSLIKKNQCQRERSQWLSHLTHRQLKSKKMKSLLDRQCLLGLDIGPEVQSHTDSHYGGHAWACENKG